MAEFNPDDGRVQLFAIKTVTDLVSNPTKEVSLTEARRSDPNAEPGSTIRYPKPTEGLGRISAQLAKQVIFQKIREAERDTISPSTPTASARSSVAPSSASRVRT